MRAQIKLCPGYCNPNCVAAVAQLGHDARPANLRRRGQVPARPNFRDGSGRFSVSTRDKKPRLGRGLKFHLPEEESVACAPGPTYDARFRRSRHQVLW
jgi:hypothetical protein